MHQYEVYLHACGVIRHSVQFKMSDTLSSVQLLPLPHDHDHECLLRSFSERQHDNRARYPPPALRRVARTRTDVGPVFICSSPPSVTLCPSTSTCRSIQSRDANKAIRLLAARRRRRLCFALSLGHFFRGCNTPLCRTVELHCPSSTKE